MKKYLFLVLSGLTFSFVQSQEVVDALRYSQDNITGTARFRAMSGAFGALGGDLSSLNVNPAGSAVFANNQLTFTFSNFDIKNNSDYFNNKTTEKESSFDINQAGAVFVFNNHNPNSNWKKIALALNYENTNNFDNSIYSAGTNTNNSIANYFLNYANANNSQAGLLLSTIKDYYYEDLNNFADQQAYIGILTNIIKPTALDENNDSYISNNTGGNYYQENSIVANGYNGKLSFNGAASYKDKIYFGLNLNSHFTDYTQSSSFYERNNTNSNDGLKNLVFNNELYTYGTGFSFNLGIIGKINNEIRAGISYESPTWYKLNDELKQNINSTGYNFIDYGDPTYNSYPIISGISTANSDSNITIIYPTYKLKTPSKLTGSFAYIFGKKGLISIDYTVKDYSNTKLKPENDDFYKDLNNEMNNILDFTNEVRIGGEYKIERLSLRAGYRFEGSPYKNKTTVGDLNGYSAGLGYNFGGTRLDLSYAYAKRNSQQGFFSQGFTDGASIDSINNTVSLSLLFEL